VNSLLERVNLVCRHVQRMGDSPLTFKKLIVLIRRSFRDSDIDILLKTKKSKILDNEHYYVEAFYDADNDFNNEVPIEVFIHHNFSDINPFNTPQVTELLIQIFDAVTHELRHQQQSKKRNYQTYSNHDSEPYSKYLADPDELDAYSLSIAIELLRYLPKERAERYMSKLTVFSKLKHGAFLISPTLSAYIGQFKKNPLLKKLSKKVYKNIEMIDPTQIFK
jgi:hypothetical protein